CGEQELRTLERAGELLTLAAGQLLQRSSDRWTSIYFVLDGTLGVDLESGPSFVCKEGSVIGLDEAFNGRHPPMSIAALSDATVFCVERRRLQQTVRRCPGFALGLIRELAAAAR
ncbi:MAG: Crp/Fnr family transcriptional regulator, partial [Candidatus Binatia bacterium]